MRLFCWDSNIADDSYGNDASAAVIAPSVDAARDLVRREWACYLAANPRRVWNNSRGEPIVDEKADREDAPYFYGVGSPRFYALGIVAGLERAEPSRVIDLPETTVPQIVLMAKGYEG